MFLSAGQTSDYIGARALLSSIPSAGALLADRGYDADWFRNALIEMGISPCIPFRTGRKVSIPHDTELYRLRHRIENMFARLKDWRRIATRYDRCPILFLSACALAATVVYWLCVLTLAQKSCGGLLPFRCSVSICHLPSSFRVRYVEYIRMTRRYVNSFRTVIGQNAEQTESPPAGRLAGKEAACPSWVERHAAIVRVRRCQPQRPGQSQSTGNPPTANGKA